MRNFLMMALAASALFSSPALAGPRADLQGFWGGGLRQGSGRITVEAKIVGERAKIDLNMRYWGKQRQNLNCQFYSKLDDSGAGPVFLNAGRSDGACPTKGSFAFKRLSPEQIELRGPAMGGRAAFKLNESMRPLKPEEIAPLPEGFKILDLAIGMSRSEIEAALQAQGYRQTKLTAVASRTGNWRAEMVEYAPDGAEDAGDVVTVGYSLASPPAASGEQIALIVQRLVTPSQERPLQAIALRGAIKARYGDPSASTDRGNYMNFKYLANGAGAMIHGRNAERVFCRKGTRSSVQLGFRPNGWRSGSDLRSHCGSKLEIYADIDQRLGTVRSYSQGLSSVDLATTDFWRKLAADLEEELKTFIQTRENSSTGAIKL